MNNIVIFASGGGSNAAKIIDYFRNHKSIKVVGIITNNADAYIVDIANQNDLPCKCISKKTLNDEVKMISILKSFNADFLILAGFLLLIPSFLIRNFTDKIINIHPSLLPKYGGIGMYGLNIHTAVIANKETESGLTIHLVNEEYDKGRILIQIKVEVIASDSPKDLASRILIKEHIHFSKAIEHYILEEK